MLRSLNPRLLVVICALALTSISSAALDAVSAEAKAPAQQVSLLFTQSAVHGTFVRTACRCGGRRILTLEGVAPQLVWFSDRPVRHAGQMPAGAFTRAWPALGFAADAPNAALTLLDGEAEADTVVVELLARPRYDRERRTMRYVVRLLADTPAGLADFEDARDVRVPRRFDAASLFIDSAVARQVAATELGGGRWNVELG